MKKLGKGCLFGALGLVGFVVIVFILVFTLTGDAVKAVDTFFRTVKEKHFDEAYNSAAEGFRAATTKEQFIAFVNSNGLNDYQSASWSNRSITDTKATLKGNVTTTSGGNIPLTIELVKEGAIWKIYSIVINQGGVSVQKSSSSYLPSADEQVRLVKQSMKEFAASIKARDFSGLHGNAAPQFQEQFTVEKLGEIFKPFVDADLDLTVLEPMQPLFDEEASVDENGVLKLKGHYDTTPSVTHFALSYYGGPAWRLMGINVNIE